MVRGYSQEAGIDYDKTFSPVCRIGSQRILLAIACEHYWPVDQVDVQVASLQCPIEGEVYVKMAPGQKETDSKTGAPIMMKLKHNLYGLAQSPALWYGIIDTALPGINFITTASDPCVHTYGRDLRTRRHLEGPHRLRGRHLVQRSQPESGPAVEESGSLCHD